MPISHDTLRDRFAAALDAGSTSAALDRYHREAPRLLTALSGLYGTDGVLPETFGTWIEAVATAINARPTALRQLDVERRPGWFDTPEMIGYSAYVDRFAGSLAGVSARVDYLRRLGVRYLHLLPFLRARSGENDGGFAVSDYGQVDPALGSNDDLVHLCACLREAGISLCTDLVLNHSADDHPWAVAARAGSMRHRDYYRLLHDRSEVETFEAKLPQVFPETAPGNFTHVPELDAWVWTTFHPYQWDLNWNNPEVFVEMSLALLRLANLGVEVFRLDSAAYLWKRRDSECVNLPENHTVLQALRALVDIVAPSVALKAEVIMPMQALPPYFGQGEQAGHECHLAYHSSLMAAAWAALAEQRGEIAAAILERTPVPPPGCAWITYVRCHDDIGWRVLEDEAASPNGFDLERISRFLAGQLPGSYARGEAFQSATEHGAHGSNGMTAALAGLTSAEATDGAEDRELALRRVLLLYGLALCAGGVPLIYMGDELGLGNDSRYRDDPARNLEGRCLHRPAMDWPRADSALHRDDNPVFRGLRRLIATRCRCPALTPSAPMRVLALDDPGLLGLCRGNDFMALFNFSARTITVDVTKPDNGWQDLLTGQPGPGPGRLQIEPYGQRWLQSS